MDDAQAGWHRTAPSGQTMQGTYALFGNYLPYAYPGYESGLPNHSVAYIGLFNGSTYALGGWWVENTSGFDYKEDFVEYNNGSGRHISGFTHVGGYYSAYYDPSSDDLNIYINNVSRLSLLDIPWTPVQARNYSAVSTYRNQMPGASSVPQAFTNAHVRYGGVDYAFNGSGFNSNWNEFGLSIPGGAGGLTMTTWDKKCQF